MGAGEQLGPLQNQLDGALVARTDSLSDLSMVTLCCRAQTRSTVNEILSIYSNPG